MFLSLFRSLKDTEPISIELTWLEFITKLKISTKYREKKQCPLWSPARYPKNKPRGDDYVIDVSMLVLDIDTETEETALNIAELITGYNSVLHTTWSHLRKYRCPFCNFGHYLSETTCSKTSNQVPDKSLIPRYCIRVIFQLSRPVAAYEWNIFWNSAVKFLKIPADNQCKDVSHTYFEPACPVEFIEEHFILKFKGKPLDVDQIIKKPVEDKLVVVKKQEKLTRERFERFARSLCKKRQDYLVELGERLIQVCNGESFAEEGERDRTLFRLSVVLAERFPEVDPNSIASHFALSIDRMSNEPEPLTLDLVKYKLERAQDEILLKKQEEVTKQTTDRSKRIQEAFNSDRVTPYEEDECAPYQRWIIQHSSSYYFWLDGGYEGPYTIKDARAAAIRDLMPAYPYVSLYQTDAKGTIVPKTLEQLVIEYGTVAHNVVADLRAQKSYYEEKERIVIEAPCAIRDLEPVYDEDISQYLKLLGRDRHEDLLTWVAALTVLEYPCAALFLVGPKGSGKSLFAYGHSRIWSTERPTFMDEALHQFNDALLKCPLILADEAIPRDFRGYAKNSELRHLIQSVSRPLSRKFLPSATLLGATRTIVAANNEEVLATPESLSNYDIDAIAARYFYIPTTEELCEFLEEKRPRDTGWVSKDRMAKHALWLKENHVWDSSERFIIKPTNQQLHRSLTVRSGVRSAICQWICSFLIDQERFLNNGRGTSYVLIEDGQIWINVQAIYLCWSIYIPNEPCPSMGKLSSSLSALCLQGRKQRRHDGKKINYRQINSDNLFAWAEQSGYTDTETIQNALEQGIIYKIAKHLN